MAETILYDPVLQGVIRYNAQPTLGAEQVRRRVEESPEVI
jgi:hypothetical protein